MRHPPHALYYPCNGNKRGQRLIPIIPNALYYPCTSNALRTTTYPPRALQNNEIAGAGLDVFEQEPVDPENPLLKMDNVSVTNHYASYSEAAWERANTQLGEEAIRIADGYWPMSLINPEVKHYSPQRKDPISWEVMLARR